MLKKTVSIFMFFVFLLLVGCNKPQEDISSTFATVQHNYDGSKADLTAEGENSNNTTGGASNGTQGSGTNNTDDSSENDVVIEVKPINDRFNAESGILKLDNGRSVNVYNHTSGVNSPTWSKSSKVKEQNVAFFETAIFYKGRTTLKLLYPIANVVSVYSYGADSSGNKIIYEPNVDYTVTEDGQLALTDKTSIPIYQNVENLRPDSSANLGSISNQHHKYLIAVTYTYVKEWNSKKADYSKRPDIINKLDKIYDRLNSNGTVNVLFVGDSITAGENSTGNSGEYYKYEGANNPPSGPSSITPGWLSYLSLNSKPSWTGSPWTEQVAKFLENKYTKSSINITNRGVSGGSTGWCINNLDTLLKKSTTSKPDIAFIAFGMNESTIGKTAFKINTDQIIYHIRTLNPDCSIVLVSAFSPNYPNNYVEGLRKLEVGLKELANEQDNIAFAPVYSVFDSIRKVKDPLDYTGNGWNHPNDYAIQIYANTIITTLNK